MRLAIKIPSVSSLLVIHLFRMIDVESSNAQITLRVRWSIEFQILKADILRLNYIIWESSALRGRLFILTIASIFLPYGVVVSPTAIESVLQFWLFPFWMYVNDFGFWMGLGAIVPAFTTSFPAVLVILGFTWFAVAIIIGVFLFRFWEEQTRMQWIQRILFGVLIAQSILTILLLLLFWDTLMAPIIIPLPLHTAFAFVSAKLRSNDFETGKSVFQ